MLMAALKAKLSLEYLHLTTSHSNFPFLCFIFLTWLFAELEFGDDDAADICVTMVSFWVRNVDV